MKYGTDGRPATMEFCIEKNSSTPIVNQIEEQIKLAVMMGLLRSGDTLPSIRDIERQTGINRNQIHKAYLALRRSGLLVLTRGKGSVVTTVAVSPRSISEHCRKMSKEFLAKVRQSAISPTAFARFFSRHAQETERKMPLISYVDMYEDLAVQTADEISELWQVPVRALAFRNLKTILGRNHSVHKLLVNHVMCDDIRSLLPKRKSDVIPIEVHYSGQTIKHLGQIEPDSSVLLIILTQSSHRVSFMITQLRKLIQSPGIEIHSMSIDEVTDFKGLLNCPQYDYLLIGPGVRGQVPEELRQDPRILVLNVEIDPASLEAARIRAGVIL